MKVSLKVDVKFNREQLCNAVSNALYFEFTDNNKKRILEMTLYDLAKYIPEKVADMIIQDTDDILYLEQSDED